MRALENTPTMGIASVPMAAIAAGKMRTTVNQAQWQNTMGTART